MIPEVQSRTGISVQRISMAGHIIRTRPTSAENEELQDVLDGVVVLCEPYGKQRHITDLRHP
jgi:hypothetical protein